MALLARKCPSFPQKEKERKKDEAAAAKLAAQFERDAKRRIAKLQVDAAKVLSKVSPLLTQLKDLRGRPRYSQTPKDAKNKFEGVCGELERYHNAAEERVRGTTAEPFSFSLDDVVNTAKIANDQIKTLSGILGAYDKIA